MVSKDDNFEALNWADDEHVKKYVESVDIIIPDRRRFQEILASFFSFHFGGSNGVRLLDLGSGDGFFVESLLNIDDSTGSIEAVLVDGSGEMLKKAGERLSGFKDVSFVESTFEGLLDNARPQALKGGFDMIISSLAIHHIPTGRRAELFDYIHSLLKDGGRFINFDICKSLTEGLEDFYVKLWEERVIKLEEASGMEVDYKRFMNTHRDREHKERLLTLTAQLDTLRESGFKEVDIYYKHGLFAVYGAQREGGSSGD